MSSSLRTASRRYSSMALEYFCRIPGVLCPIIWPTNRSDTPAALMRLAMCGADYKSKILAARELSLVTVDGHLCGRCRNIRDFDSWSSTASPKQLRGGDGLLGFGGLRSGNLQRP